MATCRSNQPLSNRGKLMDKLPVAPKTIYSGRTYKRTSTHHADSRNSAVCVNYVDTTFGNIGMFGDNPQESNGTGHRGRFVDIAIEQGVELGQRDRFGNVLTAARIERPVDDVVVGVAADSDDGCMCYMLQGP